MKLNRILASLTAALLAAVPLFAGKADVYAVVGARVLPISGPALDDATVVMRDGVIEAVGKGVAVPADARVLDGKGLTLTPGLIDGFGSVGLPAAPRGGSGGGARSAAPSGSGLEPEALALDSLRPADALKARDAGITTALVVSKDGVVPGRSVLVNLSGEDAEGMVLDPHPGLHLQMTTLRRQYPGSLMGTVAYARQALYDAAHYRDVWADYERAPRGKTRPKYDAALEAWQQVLAGQSLFVTCSRENDVRRALGLADEFKIGIVLVGAPQAFKLAALLKQRALPLLVTVNFDPPAPASFGFFGGGADEEQQRREIEEAETNPARLHEAGVRFALVSGHAPSFLAGVRKAIEKGLPSEAALRAVTLAAAEALGIADRTGSLEPGKLANVVAWSGEPLAKDTKAKLVFVDGKLYEPSEPERPRGGPPGRGDVPGEGTR